MQPYWQTELEKNRVINEQTKIALTPSANTLLNDGDFSMGDQILIS